MKEEKFDVIFCGLVLQHIYEDALGVYLKDFKNMTKKMIVMGRRFNDDPKGRSTWTILGENGWVPSKFLSGLTQIPYTPDGNPEDHNIAIYD